MLTRERTATISKLAYPITIAMSSTLVMTLVDLAFVGPLGTHASAAVGVAVFSYALILAFVTGLAPAVQGLVARRRGEGSAEPECLSLNGGLLIAVVLGTPLMIIGYLLAPSLFSVISPDPGVVKVGIPFLQVLYLSVVAAGMNNAFKGHWSGVEKPNVYMLIILFMNILNFLGDYVLIQGRLGFPALGATGAAVSTTLSLYVGVVINLVLSWRYFRKDGFLRARPVKSLLVRIAKLALPATMQELFFSAGFVVFLWLVAQVGTAELAGANVMIRISLVLMILANSVGMASATLVSKTIGEGDLAGAARWGWDSAMLGVIGITILGLPILLFPRFFLTIFFTDPHTIAISTIPLQLQAATAGLGSLISIFAYTLVTLGDGARVVMVSLGTQWLFFLPAVWFVGPHLHYGLLQITFVDVAYGAIATTLITMIWIQGRWKKIAI